MTYGDLEATQTITFQSLKVKEPQGCLLGSRSFVWEMLDKKLSGVMHGCSSCEEVSACYINQSQAI